MKTKKIIGLIIFPIIFLLTGCPPMGDCTHHFTYQGSIKATDSLYRDSLIIRFDNLGDIIFNIHNRRLLDTSIIDNKGYYKIMGDFFTACSSDKNIFDNKDSISFEIVRKNKIIKSGKFSVKDVNREYKDSAYFTIINFPSISIN